MKLEEVILRDTRANQPAATDVPSGTLYYVTDESVTERSNGTAWQDYSDAGSGSGITELTGDVTAGPGSGSQAATIASAAVTFAKMQNIATDRLVGRDTAASGSPEEISVSSGIEFTGSTGIRATENIRKKILEFAFDGGGSTPATGTGLPLLVNFNGTITRAVIVGDSPTGSAVVDIWKSNYAGYPPVVGGSITSATPPTLTSADKAEDTTLTSWTTSVTAGDFYMANLNSVSGHTWVKVFLEVLVS